MGFRINRGVFQFKDGETFRNKFKIDTDGQMVEVDGDGNAVAPYMRFGDKAHDADFLDGIDSSNFIRTTNNSTLNSDTRNTRGVTRLYRNDSDSNYNVQTYWTGAHWFLRGYSGDTFHAEVRVGKADSADNATNASYLTGGDTSFRGLLYHSLNGDLNQYNVAGLYSAEYVGGTNIPLDQRGHFIQISDAGGTDVKTQWYYQSNGEKIHMRLMWGAQNWFEWRELITDSNIGSQSVNYAASAGNADTVDGYHATNAAGGLAVINANGYWYPPSWINVGNTGIYSGTNGAHFLPNNTSPHGAWEMIGSKGGWSGIYFRDSGNTLMANSNDSGFYNKNAGWQMEWHNGRLLVSKQANGGGTLAEVIDSTTIGSQSVSDSDKLDGSHKHEVGNRDYTRTGFFVDGDENTYYPVLITPRGGYAFNRWSISRRYSWTAPWDPIGTGSHKGGLTFDFYWSGDTAWGGNDKAVRIHQFSEQYTTMLGGIRLARTGGMIVWLRGGHAYYELQVDTAPTTVDVKLEAWTDGSGQVFEPTEDVNEHRDTIWNNYPVRHGDELYINNRAVATEQWTDDTFLRTTEKAADSELLDGVNSTSFLRSDTNDTMSGNLTLKYSTADSDDYNALILAAGSNDYIIKASTSRGVFGRKSFGWHVDTSSAFGVYSNGWTKLFGVEGGTGNAFATGTFTANNISTNQVFMQSITSDGTIANDKGSYLHLGGWAVGRTHASAVLVNTAYRADYAESLFDMNISRFTNNSGYITQDSVDALAEELRPQIETAQSTADGKLGATAKAADSNLLDGYDHTAFWKDNEDRRASVIRFTGEGGDSGNGSINYGIYQEGGAWSHPYPDLIIAYHTGIKIGGYKNYGGVKIYNDAPERSGAAQVASFGDGDANVRVANNLHIGSAGGWITDLLNAKATTGDVAGVDARINDEVLPQITTNAENIARNATDIATKLGTTGKAADADKLDGYDWMQSGKSVRANEFYADNWFRSYNSGEGIYNEATGQHWYSDSSSRWRMRSGNGSEAWMMLCTSDNTTRGSFYANNSNEVGILDQGNAWAIKHVNDSGTYFYTDNTTEEFKVGRDVVSGSYGTVQTSTTRSGWGGYSINGAYVFMSDHSSTCGIFNDIDNEWMAIFRRNAEVELMYNGAMKLETTSTGVSVSGNVNASAFIGSLDWSNVTNKPVIPAATEPVQATVEGGQDSTLSSISFSPGEGVATFTLADGQTFRLAFAR